MPNLDVIASKFIKQLRNEDADRCRKELKHFVKQAWPIVVPDARPMIDNWHIDVMCEHLEALYRGEIKKLLINVPPGMSKSRIASILFPTWVWLQDPKTCFLWASYSHALGVEFGEYIVRLIRSQWFRDRFESPSLPTIAPPSDFALQQGGWRYTTTPHGQVTGSHADIRGLDDPIKPEDAYADRKECENVNRWIEDTWLSRAKDLRTVRDLLIMQRLSENDPAQWCIDHGWEALVLPARYEPNRYADTRRLPNGKELLCELRSIPGENLCPERLPDDYLDSKSPYVYASQYQQRPAPDGGTVFEEKWLQNRWTLQPASGTWCISLDATFKDEQTSDYVVFQVWCLQNANFYLIDQVRDRLSFTETCQTLERLALMYPKAHAKLIEDKANGPAVADALRKKVSGIILVTPEGGKISRANAVQPLFAAGNVILPSSAPWLPEYIHEMKLFPLGKHDDQVDATSQALVWLAEKNRKLAQATADVEKAMLGVYGRDDITGPSDYQRWRSTKAPR